MNHSFFGLFIGWQLFSSNWTMVFLSNLMRFSTLSSPSGAFSSLFVPTIVIIRSITIRSSLLECRDQTIIDGARGVAVEPSLVDFTHLMNRAPWRYRPRFQLVRSYTSRCLESPHRTNDISQCMTCARDRTALKSSRILNAWVTSYPSGIWWTTTKQMSAHFSSGKRYRWPIKTDKKMRAKNEVVKNPQV